MPHLDKPDVVLPCAQRLHDAVDAVARQTEYDAHVPGGQALDQNICGSLAHVTLHRAARRTRGPNVWSNAWFLRPAGRCHTRADRARGDQFVANERNWNSKLTV